MNSYMVIRKSARRMYKDYCWKGTVTFGFKDFIANIETKTAAQFGLGQGRVVVFVKKRPRVFKDLPESTSAKDR